MATAWEQLKGDARARPPIAALILGSGLNSVTDSWPMIRAASFVEVPGLPLPTVAGHRGRVALHACEAGTILVFQGRVHFYEGHSWDQVARPIRLAADLGVRNIVLTNASGGIGPAQSPGSLMLIRQHIAAMRPNWWRRGFRASPYSPTMVEQLRRAAGFAHEPVCEGTYACVTGPNYETPAEVRALQQVGADAVGMSTVHEADVAAELGLKVAGISCVANRAAGLSPTPLAHAEVLAVVQAMAERLARILSRWVSASLSG